jgi:hypothetical protein
VIGLCQEPGWETVTALFLPETTDSLFLRSFHNPVKEGLPTNRTELMQRYVSGGRCPTLA